MNAKAGRSSANISEGRTSAPSPVSEAFASGAENPSAEMPGEQHCLVAPPLAQFFHTARLVSWQASASSQRAQVYLCITVHYQVRSS